MQTTRKRGRPCQIWLDSCCQTDIAWLVCGTEHRIMNGKDQKSVVDTCRDSQLLDDDKDEDADNDDDYNIEINVRFLYIQNNQT